MKKVILLIEDNQDIRESAAELLRIDGYEVIEATSGEEALIIIASQLPDLVICDIVMGGIDGYEVARRVKADEQTRTLPFIFSTAKSEKRDRQKALDIGVRYYLTKPFDEDELIRCIEQCLAE